MTTIELDIEPKTGGDIYRFSPSSLSLSTERVGSPATLTGDIPDISGAIPEMGSAVRLTVDGQVVFYGFLFSASLNRWNNMSFTAYDQLRYLKANYTGYFPTPLEPKDLISEIANFYKLSIGTLESTGYSAKRLLIEDECCLDAIQKQIDLAIVNTQKIWTFYDDNGKLMLKSADEMITNIELTPDAFVTDYSLTTDIDTDTFNAVALYRPSSEKASKYVASASDAATQAKWGVLMLSERVDENMNTAQMDQKASNLLKMKNRAVRNLSISSLGVIGLRAGMMVTINFPDLPGISKRKLVILDSVTHSFEQNTHTMELQTKTLWEDSP